jgi:hypothetical protein
MFVIVSWLVADTVSPGMLKYLGRRNQFPPRNVACVIKFTPPLLIAHREVVNMRNIFPPVNTPCLKYQPLDSK